jgi:spore germination protein YaaH
MKKVTGLLILLLSILKIINSDEPPLCDIYYVWENQNYLYQCQNSDLDVSFTAKVENNQEFVMDCNFRQLTHYNYDSEEYWISLDNTTISTCNITQLTVKNCQLEDVKMLVLIHPALVQNISTISFQTSKTDDASDSQLPGPLVYFTKLKKLIFTVSKDGSEESSEGMYHTSSWV